VLQRRLAHRADDKAHIGLLQQQGRHHLGRVQACTFTCTCGYSAEAGHGARQHFAAERKHRQHLQPVGRLAVAQIGRQALHLVELLEQFLDVREQRQGLVRRREPPRARWNSAKPSCSSACCSVRLTAGCVTLISRAAR
jgi:hypothetical protein